MREIFITSSVLILAILLIRTLVKGRINPCIQYTLWLLVVIRLVLPMPLWNSRFSIMNLFPEILAYETDKTAGISMNSDITETNGSVDMHDIVKTDGGAEEYGPEYTDSRTYISDQEDVDSRADISNPVSSVNNEPVSANEVSNLVAVAIAAFNMIKNILPFIWAAGVALTGGYMLFYHIKWKRYLCINRKPFSGLDGMGRYRDALSVYTVDYLPSPCLSGRSIYLTKKMAEDKDELEHILAHEYCHYRQFDSVWVVVRCVLTAVYWFNPLVWVAAYASKQDSELACDEAAIHLLGEEERLAYGKTLVRLVSDFSNSKYFIGIASTMSGGEKGIKERIGMIAGKRKYVAAAAVAVLLIAVALVAVTFSGAGKGSDDLTITYLSEMDDENDVTDTHSSETGKENNGMDKDASETFDADKGNESQEEMNESDAQEKKKWIKVVVKDIDGNEYEGWVNSEEEGILYYSSDGGETYNFVTDDETKVVNFEILKDNEPDGVNFNVLTSDVGSTYSIVTDNEEGDVYIITDSEAGTMTYARAKTLESGEENNKKLKELEAEIAVMEDEIAAKAAAIKEAEAQMKAIEEEIKEAEAQMKAAEDALKAPSLNLLCYGYFSTGNEKISYVNPCPDYTRISDNYGSRIHPMTGVERMHYGIDLAAKQGADIVAAADGIVQDTGFDTSNGNYVILCHLSNGEFTYYTHCGAILVEKGDNVTAGEKIAEVGVTGDSTGAHLHFAVSRDGEYIEPVFEMD